MQGIPLCQLHCQAFQRIGCSASRGESSSCAACCISFEEFDLSTQQLRTLFLKIMPISKLVAFEGRTISCLCFRYLRRSTSSFEVIAHDSLLFETNHPELFDDFPAGLDYYEESSAWCTLQASAEMSMEKGATHRTFRDPTLLLGGISQRFSQDGRACTLSVMWVPLPSSLRALRFHL